MKEHPTRRWAFWRRIQYATIVLTTFAAVGVGLYFLNFYEAPTCFDGVANGDERGVDCGGDCVRICAVDVLPLEVVFARSFEVATGQYNAIAYIENPNQVAGATQIEYTLELLNDGVVVAERSGQTVVPPNTEYPVFEGRIFTENEASVTDTRLTIGAPSMWLPASYNRTQFRTTDIELRDAGEDRPRLNAEVENQSLTPATDIEVIATIFNDIGEPVTASQSFIERIEARSTETLVFTWPNPIARTVRSCIIPTDVVLGIDLSGSMNNDSDNPPQPITDALSAAATFANSLQAEDQIGVVTFASEVRTTTNLTGAHDTVATAITELEIDPESETGFTNTPDALTATLTELDSERNNPNARQVLVLLTDGLPTAPGDVDVVDEAIEEAEGLKANNIEIYSIGLGENVDADFIRTIASDESNAYFAPSSEDLTSIYAEITSSLCQSGPTRIDIIPKNVVDFAETR